MRRHGLWGANYRTRAQGVDAIRIALEQEKIGWEPSIRWRKVREGEYLSQDGAWRLERSASFDRLIPLEPDLAKGLEERALLAKQLEQRRETLRVAAIRAQQLSTTFTRLLDHLE